MEATSVVDVRVDSVFVADTSDGVGQRPVPLGQNQREPFRYTTRQTEFGKMIVFRLPGGKVLHIRPRAIDGGMIAMEVVLFDGNRTTMTVDLNLEDGGTFAMAGEQYKEGTLLLRISPTRHVSHLD